jgi:tetratricopeptide (TPR) repeat protein/serine/threonine protein kinase
MSLEFRRDYLLRLPLPLAQLYSRAHNAKDARGRHDNCFYLCEALVKLPAAVAVSGYLDEARTGAARAPALDRLLAHLALPSLGQWVMILRELARHFGHRPDAAAHPLGHLWAQLTTPRRDLPGLLALYRRIKNGPDGDPAGDTACPLLGVFDALVQYRNAVFGHGAARTTAFYEGEMGPLLFPAVNDLLAEGVFDPLGPADARLVYLTDLRVLDGARVEVGARELIGLQGERRAPIVLTSDQAAALAPNRPAVLWPGRPVPVRLDPLLGFRESELAEEVLFLNRDRNRKQVEYLSYTTGRTERDPGMAPALADLLSRAIDRPVSEAQLAHLAEQSLAETPSVEALVGDAPPPATTVGDYEVLAELGRGGMGVVYLARQRSLGRPVALKLLPDDLSADEVALARFRREVRALSRCDHPGVVKVLNGGSLPDGRAFLAMEYIPGCDLEMVWRELAATAGTATASELGGATWGQAVSTGCRKQRAKHARAADGTAGPGPLPAVPALAPGAPPAVLDSRSYVQVVAALVRDAALALQAVHDRGLVHRDVKPANLMLTPDGSRVVLMDFGLAKSQSLSLTAGRDGGGLLGTLRYAAPEQLAAASLTVGPAADVRGLGVTLWELLTRRRLFAEAGDERQLAQLVHEQDVPRLRRVDATLDRDLEAIVARATERRVADRIPTAARLAEYLTLYLAGKPLPIRPPGVVERAGRWVRRNKAAAATAVALVVAAAGLIVGQMAKTAAEEKQKRQEHDHELALQAESEKRERERLQNEEERRAAEERRRQEREEERKAYLGRLRSTAEADIGVALAQFQAGRWEVTRRIAEEGAAKIASEPELADRRTRLGQLRDRSERLIEFRNKLNRAEYLAATWDADDRALSAAREALEPLGALSDKKKWWEDAFPAEDLTAEQLERLKVDAYRGILLWAGLYAREGLANYEKAQTDRKVAEAVRANLRKAIPVVRNAKRFRPSYAATALETLCIVGLLSLNGFDYLPPLNEMSKLTGPVTATDYYLTGIAHLFLGELGDDANYFSAQVKKFGLPGLDVDQPWDTARKYLVNAARLEARHYWTHYWLGFTCHDLSRPEEAERAFTACITLNPEYAAGYAGRGKTLIALIERVDPGLPRQEAKTDSKRAEDELRTRALADLEAAIRLDRNPEVLEAVADGRVAVADSTDDPARRKEHLTAARAVYDELIRGKPSATGWLAARARVHIALGDFDRALADGEAAARADATWAGPFLAQGLARLGRAEYDPAIAAFDQALAIWKDHPEAVVGRAVARTRKGEYRPAVDDLSRAISRRKGALRLYEERALAYVGLQEYDKAVADFGAAEQLYRNRGWVTAADTGTSHHGGSAKDYSKAEYTRVLGELDRLAVGDSPLRAWAVRCRAFLYAGRGRTDAAIQAFTECVRLDPTFAEGFARRATLRALKRDRAGALADLDEAVRLEPANPARYSARAAHFAQAGDRPRAIADYTEVIRLLPDQAMAYNLRGVIYLDQPDVDRALADFEQAVRVAPRDATGHYNRAWAYEQKGDKARALAGYTEALRLNPRFTAALYQRGLLLYRQGDYDRATPDFAELVRLEPFNTRYQTDWGILLRLKGDDRAAIEVLTRALEQNGQRDETNARGWNARGMAHLALGQFDKALADFDLAVRISPKDAGYRVERGYCYYRQGNYDKAMADFDAALGMNPMHALAVQDRALVMSARGEYGPAIAECTRAVELAPRSPGHLLCRAGIHARHQKYDAAAADLTRGAEAFPTWAVRFYTALGQVHALRRKGDEALAALDKALAASPNDAVALAERGRQRAARGDAAAALEDTDQAVRLAPDAPAAHRCRGWVFAQLGQWAKADAAYARALELQSDEPEAWLEAVLLAARRGDAAGYRDVCRKMAGRFGGSREPRVAGALVAACVLTDQSGINPKETLARARAAGGDAPGPELTWLRAAALVRAGHWQEAVGALADPPADDPTAGLVVALARQAADGAEAGRALAAAEGAFAALAEGGRPVDWRIRLRWEILHKEARAAVSVGRAEAGPAPRQVPGP